MPKDAIEPTVDLVLSAEVARTGVRLVPAETVRIGKRVVTETRTVTVEVRREELYVERFAAPASAPADPGSGQAGADVRAVDRGPGPVLVVVLHEEVPEVTTRVVATERVEVFVDRVEGSETVSTDLRREEVDRTEEQPPR